MFLNANSGVSVLVSVPRTACLGRPVPLFELPFEARPVDALRREVFKQHPNSGQCWFAPAAIPVGTSSGLRPCLEPSHGPVPKALKRRRRR